MVKILEIAFIAVYNLLERYTAHVALVSITEHFNTDSKKLSSPQEQLETGFKIRLGHHGKLLLI